MVREGVVLDMCVLLVLY